MTIMEPSTKRVATLVLQQLERTHGRTCAAALASQVRRYSARPRPSEREDAVEQHHDTRFRTPVRPPKLVVAKPQQKSMMIPTNKTTQDKTTTMTDPVPEKQNQQVHSSPAELTYTGGVTMPITSELKIVTPQDDTPNGVWPVFRLMDEDGRFRSNRITTGTTADTRDDLQSLKALLQQQYPGYAEEFEHNSLLVPAKHPYADTPNSTNTLLRAHRQMLRLKEMDAIFQNIQRQGRISFYMTCRGEEAIHTGAGSALDLNDVVLAQYREAGLLMYRGFTLQQFADQCFSNSGDLGKGRQMPVHYGSRALNYQTISSPLGTQIPQATGAGYNLKLSGKPNVAICFFGDGAASTTDFHAGLNFAATLEAPVVFFCRNNGYAISTSVSEQYAGDGIISRAPGYGMAAIRVDGNDLFAVHAAVREARKYALENSAPVMVEAMTYRQGHHSTSDDSTRYRDKHEVEDFEQRCDPINRVENFLKEYNWLTDQEISQIRDEEKVAVLQAIGQAEKKGPPQLKELFTDVYKELPPHLKAQRDELHAHLEKYPNKY